MNRLFFALLFFVSLVCSLFISSQNVYADKIKIGLVSALTGESAPTGLDVKDAILFANKLYGGDRYEFVIEDDRCLGRDGASAAHKLVSIDKVKYALGFACSVSFLSAASIYEK